MADTRTDVPPSDGLSTESATKATPKDDETQQQQQPPPTIASLAQNVLAFLSTASNEQLGMLMGGLALATYLVLGQLGLLLIGTVAGVVLHVYWEESLHERESQQDLEQSRRRRKELGLEVASRLLEWSSRNGESAEADEEGETEKAGEPAGAGAEFSSLPPATAAALSTLTDAVIRDYVLYWYKPLLPSEQSFPISCRKLLVNFVTSLSTHLMRKRPADTFLQFVTNASSMIIVFLNELSLALQTMGPDMQPEDAVRQYLARNPESSLANVLSLEQQRKKLRMVADDVLSSFLDHKAYEFQVARNFLREVLAGLVLESTIKSCSQPEFINNWIVYYLKEGEPELMNAIDAGLENAGKEGRTSSAQSQSHVSGSSCDIEQTQAVSGFPANQEVTAAANEGSVSSATPDGMITPASSDGERPLRSVTEFTSEGDTSSLIRGQESQAQPLSLFGASIHIDDFSVPGDKTPIRTKPTIEYALQIEPISMRQAGWMVFRTYSDFEYLHEGLATLSRYHRTSFSDEHPILPPWKGQTKQALTQSLEKYLSDALRHEKLAESERMRKFLGKESSIGEGSFGRQRQSALESVGKNVLGVLSNAPKGVADGGKAVLDGVTGVFGNVGLTRKTTDPTSARHKSQSSTLRSGDDTSYYGRSSVDLSYRSPSSSQVGYQPLPETRTPLTGSVSSLSEIAGAPPKLQSVSSTSSSVVDVPSSRPSSEEKGADGDTSLTGGSPGESAGEPSSEPPESASKRSSRKPETETPGLTEDETRVAVELIFAVINELYGLSSAWNIRKTLLNAAKSYILRPGNQHLVAIRDLLQESMIDAQTTDEAIAADLLKLRENALPTEEELRQWPPPPSPEEREKLRQEARKLLIQRGMPQALMSVMGAAATGEALGRVFDCLQVEEVARGLVFALVLQALRAVIL